jgi:hypothetical protein
MGKFDEPIGPIPPLSPLERRWLRRFRNGLLILVVLLALALFTAVSLAEAPAMCFAPRISV